MALGIPGELDALWSVCLPPWPEDNKLSGLSPQEGQELDLETKFQTLRDFLFPRDNHSGADGRRGLDQGLLTNVLLVHDRDTVQSVMESTGFADDMWVWAVDPDYQSPSSEQPEYRGYLKVWVQQLVKNFYVARRFGSDEASMADLWVMARRSQGQAFVSLDEAELHSFRADRLLGSALKWMSNLDEISRIIGNTNAIELDEVVRSPTKVD